MTSIKEVIEAREALIEGVSEVTSKIEDNLEAIGLESTLRLALTSTLILSVLNLGATLELVFHAIRHEQK